MDTLQSGVSIPPPTVVCSPGYLKMRPNTKVSIYLNLLFCSSIFVSVCIFNAWPKTTLLLPVWPRDAKKLNTPHGYFLWHFLRTYLLMFHDDFQYVQYIVFAKVRTSVCVPDMCWGWLCLWVWLHCGGWRWVWRRAGLPLMGVIAEALNEGNWLFQRQEELLLKPRETEWNLDFRCPHSNSQCPTISESTL